MLELLSFIMLIVRQLFYILGVLAFGKYRNRQISRRMDTHGIIVVERFATFHYY